MKKCIFNSILSAFLAFNVLYFTALRAWHLRWGATKAEVSATLPGDELFETRQYAVTHAVTINATPEKVWPWIRQIGQDRSGFYSYTLVENLIGCDMPKVHRVVESWKDRSTGETVWFATPGHYKAQAKMIAARVDPNRAFAMVMTSDWQKIQAGGLAQQTLWAFTLEPVGAQQTRLIARLRGQKPQSIADWLLADLFWEPAHFVMERKMLLTIKGLAEQVPIQENAGKPMARLD
jgi:hypothetical protein